MFNEFLHSKRAGCFLSAKKLYLHLTALASFVFREVKCAKLCNARSIIYDSMGMSSGCREMEKEINSLESSLVRLKWNSRLWPFGCRT